MLITNPNLARYSDEYRRRLFLHAAMFGERGQLQALSQNLNEFGTAENPSPTAMSRGIYPEMANAISTSDGTVEVAGAL